MKAIVVCGLVLGVSLWAADVWESKPFSQWGDKDLQKIATDSPWSHIVSVSGFPGGGGGSDRGGDSGGPAASGSDQGSAESSGGGGSRGGGGGRNKGGDSGGAGGGGGGGQADTNLIVRWDSSMAMKEVQMRSKYKDEAATSPEAKAYLDKPTTYYIITVSNLPGRVIRADDEDAKKALMAATTLTPKGKDPIPALNVQVTSSGRTLVVFFAFARNVPIADDDKEVDFATKFGKVAVKTKFKPKEMMLAGKLEL